MKDTYSQKILEVLQEDSRMTVQQISERVGLSTTPCWKRIKEMEAQGIITGYTVRVNRKKVGLSLMVLAEINVNQHTEKAVAEFEAAVQATPHIVHCYSTTGPADYVLTIMVQDMDAYEHFLMQTLFKLPAVAHVRSSIVMRDIKQGACLPL
ncbi:Lrp/AsnC family transcriptional regulator [Limnohabitans sp. DM1]|uniref:Lrp/AsnC family transcriptional regulator n=1 Tax=Limnohabitans sp. DM1 TaxID=1597955 RepID=UPI000AC4CFCC|nr:Lrp/AsnC family transcriptional regulator [Limnohabitans sp. DM1]